MRNLAQKKKNEKKNSKSIFLAVAAIAVIIIIILLLAKGCGGNADNAPSENGTGGNVQTEEKGPVNPLTGEAGYPEEALGKRPITFMINNAPPARPQWGLCTPDIVYEGLVEGGASRMMWVYANPDDVPEKIGSMRSARHDFLEIAEGMDAIFVHWGGSTYAYDAINSRDVDDVDGIYVGSKYAHRDNSRSVAIEHRGYMVGSEVRTIIGNKGYRTETEVNGAPFGFTSKAFTPEGGKCAGVTASFSNYYSHTFKYDEKTGLYNNFMGETPMTQDGGQQMAVKNVIILYTPTSKMGDDLGCIDMDLTGGNGVYITNGSYQAITWKKGNTPTAPLAVLTENGEKLKVNPGKSWIGLIPKARETRTVISETVSGNV